MVHTSYKHLSDIQNSKEQRINVNARKVKKKLGHHELSDSV